MIHQLKFYGIKCQKAGFLINKVNLSDLSDKPILIVASSSTLLYMAARHVCLLHDVVDVIPTLV